MIGTVVMVTDGYYVTVVRGEKWSDAEYTIRKKSNDIALRNTDTFKEAAGVCMGLQRTADNIKWLKEIKREKT